MNKLNNRIIFSLIFMFCFCIKLAYAVPTPIQIGTCFFKNKDKRDKVPGHTMGWRLYDPADMADKKMKLEVFFTDQSENDNITEPAKFCVRETSKQNIAVVSIEKFSANGFIIPHKEKDKANDILTGKTLISLNIKNLEDLSKETQTWRLSRGGLFKSGSTLSCYITYPSPPDKKGTSFTFDREDMASFLSLQKSPKSQADYNDRDYEACIIQDPVAYAKDVAEDGEFKKAKED